MQKYLQKEKKLGKNEGTQKKLLPGPEISPHLISLTPFGGYATSQVINIGYEIILFCTAYIPYPLYFNILIYIPDNLIVRLLGTCKVREPYSSISNH